MFDTIRQHAAKLLALVFTAGNVSGCALIPMEDLWKTEAGLPYAEVCAGAKGLEGGAACTLTWYTSALAAGNDICKASETEADAALREAQEATCVKVAAIDARITPAADVAWGLLGDVAEARALAASDESSIAKAIAASKQLEQLWRERGPEIAEAVNALRGD